jgi:hypothetical protein
MKSHTRVIVDGVCAHLPLRAARDGVDFEGLRSGSGNSWGCPRVETILNGNMPTLVTAVCTSLRRNVNKVQHEGGGGTSAPVYFASALRERASGRLWRKPKSADVIIDVETLASLPLLNNTVASTSLRLPQNPQL